MGAVREFEGDDLSAALEAASSALGIAIDELQYEMVEEGRKGVFGLGARQVRVRVELAAHPERHVTPVEAEPAREPARKTAVRRPRVEPVAPAEPPSSPAQSSFRESLEHMIELMGLDLKVKVSASGQNLRAVLSGRDRRMLTQKDGQLLSSLNFLLNRMARRTWPGVGRIQVQCDGQRDRRDDELIETVREVAQRVARTGAPADLEPMNPYERRLAHITVREFPELDSHSEGDAFQKRITITRK